MSQNYIQKDSHNVSSEDLMYPRSDMEDIFEPELQVDTQMRPEAK